MALDQRCYFFYPVMWFPLRQVSWVEKSGLGTSPTVLLLLGVHGYVRPLHVPVRKHSGYDKHLPNTYDMPGSETKAV